MPTTNLRISGAQSFPISESDIRVNYYDTSQIIAAANEISPNGTQAQFYSSDGGFTWGQTNLPLASGSGDAVHGDPAVDWTSDGTAWAITIGFQRDALGFPENLHLRCYKSTDGGQTWAFESTPSGTQTNADKEVMWVDHSPTSPFKDNMYVIWHNGLPAFVARRTGIGGAWATPIQVSGAETIGTAIGGDVKTNSAGDVFAFWPDTISRKLLVVKSTDGAATFGAPVTIATTFGSYEIAVPSDDDRKALIFISGGAHRTETKNLVYAIWPDLSGAPGCTSGSGPGTDATSTCKSRIWFSRSTDGGATWEPARMINNQASLNDQFHPRLAVDETNGELVVIYDDTVSDLKRLQTDVWMQTSCDHGVTWSPATKVTTAQTDETVSGADKGQLGNQYGDYNGLSGYAGRFFPSWTDRRSGGREEIWTAPIPKEMIDPGNPFSFGGSWLDQGAYVEGANETGEDIEVGHTNFPNADPDNDPRATIITSKAHNNAALAGVNRDTTDGGVGVFGQSKSSTRGIGVLGQSSEGCGVYGLATVPSHGIGVVGRSMEGVALESDPVETILGSPIGVLGHSTNGPGVRGHGGPLQVPSNVTLCPVQADPGGVFSSGQLQDIVVAEVKGTHEVSFDSLPQLRLIPSMNAYLPAVGQLGDLYVQVTGDITDPAGTLGVNMYLCVSPGDGTKGNVAMWAPFMFGPIQKGGT